MSGRNSDCGIIIRIPGGAKLAIAFGEIVSDDDSHDDALFQLLAYQFISGRAYRFDDNGCYLIGFVVEQSQTSLVEIQVNKWLSPKILQVKRIESFNRGERATFDFLFDFFSYFVDELLSGLSLSPNIMELNSRLIRFGVEEKESILLLDEGSGKFLLNNIICSSISAITEVVEAVKPRAQWLYVHESYEQLLAENIAVIWKVSGILMPVFLY